MSPLELLNSGVNIYGLANLNLVLVGVGALMLLRPEKEFQWQNSLKIFTGHKKL